MTGHHATRAGFAFKWADKPADTVLDHIEWSCAATAITPVAVFVPVELEGTTVKRASLHNISECRRLGIGGRGTKLKVIKANMIIPMVIEAHPEGELTVPDRCPACGEKTDIRYSPSGAETLHCGNQSCPAKQIKLFSRFVSKDGMDIDGMSEQTVRQLIASGFIHSYPDVYSLAEHAEEMKELDGFGELSVSNLLSAVERSRDVTAPKFLYALGIPMCGHDVCRKLTGRYPIQKLFVSASAAADENDIECFSDIDGIGPEKSAAVVNWFSSDENRDVFTRLSSILRIEDVNDRAAGDKCEGLQFVITGNVARFANRAELKAYIESQGGRCTGTVTSKTDFLINNDITSRSGKNQKAAELGVPVISEEGFIGRYGAPEELV